MVIISRKWIDRVLKVVKGNDVRDWLARYRVRGLDEAHST